MVESTPERVLPKSPCCIYLRTIRGQEQTFSGTGLSELLGGRKDFPNATEWLPFPPSFESGLCGGVAPQYLAEPHSDGRLGIDTYSIRLTNLAGQSTLFQCVEADYISDVQSASRVRLGIIAKVEYSQELTARRRELTPPWTALARGVPGVIARLDASGSVTFVNDLGRNVLGVPCRIAPTGSVALHSISSHVRQVIEDSLAEVLATHQRVSHDVQYPGNDVITTLHFVPDEAGADGARGVLVIGQVYRQIPSALVLPEQHPGRFDLLFAAVSDPVIVAEAETGRLLDANPAATNVYGYTRAQFLGLTWDDLIAAPSDSVLLHRTPTGTGVTLSYHRRQDGTVFPVEAKENSFSLGDHVIVVSTIRDVTERLQAEREQLQLEARMQQAQKLESLGVLAGGIAHDFNNLLSGILGSLDLAAAELLPDSTIHQSLTLARECAERASVLCDQLLAYSGRGRFVVEPVSLTNLVEDLRPLLEVSLVNKPRLTFELEPSLPLIDVDSAQIRQVVLNLVMNAAEATPTGIGHVIVRSNVTDVTREELSQSLLGDDLKPGRYVALEVIDNGCGMAESTLERIFEPFYTTKFAGRGLGLPALLGIVRGHRGTIDVVSTEGRGSVFRVLLPINRHRSSVLPSASTTWWHGRGCILFADDEPPVRTVGRRILEKLGFQVILAQNGSIAVDEFARRADEISLVILDLTMPEMTGDQALAAIRRIRPQVPIVLTSGFGEEEVVERLANVPIDGFLKKPFRVDEFSNLVRAVLERRSVSGITSVLSGPALQATQVDTRAKGDR